MLSRRWLVLLLKDIIIGTDVRAFNNSSLQDGYGLVDSNDCSYIRYFDLSTLFEGILRDMG